MVVSREPYTQATRFHSVCEFVRIRSARACATVGVRVPPPHHLLTQGINAIVGAFFFPAKIGGKNVSGEYFDGLIDNVRVYSRALVAEEIQTNMVMPIG